MTDKAIKRFQLDVWVKDTGDWHSQSYDRVNDLVNIMRERGYVPVLDLNPYIKVEYNEKEDRFELVLTMHGVHVGRSKSWDTEGIANGKLLPRATRKSK